MEREVVKVFIQGNVWAADIRMMLLGYRPVKYVKADTIHDADMVLYTGGADVDPKLYGERKLDGTGIDPSRDAADIACYDSAHRMGKFQVGICRGSQFLNVMNGGKLWQDIDRHAGNHYIEDILTGKVFLGSSTHHQQSILNSNGILLAKGVDGTHETRASKKISATNAWARGSKCKSDDVEAYWYPMTRCLGVQFHPEIGPKSCEDMFFEYVEAHRKVA